MSPQSFRLFQCDFVDGLLCQTTGSNCTLQFFLGGRGLLRVISVVPMLFAALILRTDRRIVMQLRGAKATSSESAVHLQAPPILGSWRLRRLADAGAICLVRPETYYLHENGYAAYRKLRRRRILLVIGIVIPLILIFWLSQNPQ